MNQEKEQQITVEDVTNWTLGTANESVVRRIEVDMERPDSEVQDYLDWIGGAPRAKDHPKPRIVERDVEKMYKAAGGRYAFEIGLDRESKRLDREMEMKRKMEGRDFPRLYVGPDRER
jgi:hypothetical protein